MKTTLPTTSPVDRPTRIAIARWIAGEAAIRKDFDGDAGNFERSSMTVAAEALSSEPPNVATALSEAEEGAAHAWRGLYEEQRFEAWACVAVVALLSPVGD